MTPEPAVTVMLTVYNGMPFVVEAIGSVLAQDFADFELLVVDDGSTDGTAEAVGAVRDPRVELIRRPHQGRVAALNHAVGRARGRYLANLDADDLALPGRLRLPVEFLDAHPHVAAVGSAVVPYVGGGRRDLPLTDARIRWAFLRRMPMVHSATTYRLSAVRQVGGFDPAYDAYGDAGDLLLRLAAGHRVANLPVPLAAKRRHAGQAFAGAKRERRSSLHVAFRLRAARELGFPPALRPAAYAVAAAAALRAWLELRVPRRRRPAGA